MNGAAKAGGVYSGVFRFVISVGGKRSPLGQLRETVALSGNGSMLWCRSRF